MLAYVVRRLLLMVPTLFGIMLVNFVIVQAAPGGPVEQMIAQIRGAASRRRRGWAAPAAARRRAARPGGRRAARTGRTAARAGSIRSSSASSRSSSASTSRPAQRFLQMMRSYLVFDFGNSFFRDRPVLDLIAREAAGVDLARAVDDAAHLPDLDPARHRQGGARRHAASTCGPARVVIVGYAIPGFLFAILLIVLFAGGSFVALVPAARPDLRRLGADVLAGPAPSTTSGTSRCRSSRW